MKTFSKNVLATCFFSHALKLISKIIQFIMCRCLHENLYNKIDLCIQKWMHMKYNTCWHPWIVCPFKNGHYTDFIQLYQVTHDLLHVRRFRCWWFLYHRCVCVCQHKLKKKYSASRGHQYVPALKKGGL